MATGVWTFSVLPDTITTIYVNGFQRTRSTTSPYKFIIDGYTNGTIVTISATGYNPKSVTVGESSITLTLASQEISKLSNGTDTYNIKDNVAREAIDNLATVATSGSYNDLSNKPTIPTVNNATLTIQTNGTNVATFTANASSNVTANISIPNTVSSVSSSSTNADAVGAKLFYDTVGDIESTINTIRGV